MKILILENGNSINTMISPLIKAENYKILLIENCLGNRSRLPVQIPDLVIADLTSIRGQKVELLIELKSSLVTSYLSFLFITSAKEMGIEPYLAGKEKHFSSLMHYLEKPFTKEELFELVKKIIRQMDRLSPW